MSELYAVLDVTSWEPAGEEQIGSKPKWWLRHPSTDEQWLWKESTWNLDASGRRYRKGDDWSERVAREVGVALGVPTAQVELAVRDDRVGVVSKNFLVEGESLTHGYQLLADTTEVGADPRDRSNYNLDAVCVVLEGVAGPSDDPSLGGAVDWFAGFLVLDALVGNTDRHQQNWGLIESVGGRRLAPSYDHASCLGFLLDDRQRKERLETRDGNRIPLAYAAKARSPFEGSPHPVEMAVRLLAAVRPVARNHWERAVEALPDIDPILARVPSQCMTEPSRSFARGLFAANHQVLSHRLRTMSP